MDRQVEEGTNLGIPQFLGRHLESRVSPMESCLFIIIIDFLPTTSPYPQDGGVQNIVGHSLAYLA